MTTNEKRIANLERALNEACALLQRPDLPLRDRERLTTEANLLTQKIEELAA